MFKSTIKRSNKWRFLVVSTAIMCCSTLVLVAFCAATSICSGLFMKSCANLRMGGANVAENKRVCRCLGNICMIWRMSSIKPMSNIRSASSNTKISTLLRLMFFCLMWSSKRPTVATTISQPWRNSAVCLSILTPPNNTVWRKGRFFM